MKIMSDIEEVAYRNWKKVNRKKSIVWVSLTVGILLVSVIFPSPLIFIPASLGLFSHLAYLFWQYKGTKKTMRELLEEQGR